MECPSPPLVLAALLAWAALAAADDDATENAQSAERIADKLTDVEAAPEGMLRKEAVTLMDRIDAWRERVRKQTGLSFGLAYTALWQHASESLGAQDAAGGVVDFFGTWQVRKVNGTLGFAIDNRHSYTRVAPGNLYRGVGSLWPSVSGYVNRDYGLKQLWWKQLFFDGLLAVTVGRTDPAAFYEGNRLQNLNQYFVDFSFSDNPAGGQPFQGFGANVLVDTDTWWATVGIHDANGDPAKSGFETFGEAWFYEAQVAWTPRFGGEYRGNYRLAAWHSEATPTQPSGSGFVLSFDQELSQGAGPFWLGFLRYAYQDAPIRFARQYAAGGVAVQGLVNLPDDYLGLALSWGQPHDRSLRDQYVTEIFWRLQLLPNLRLTPSVQLILDPSNDPAESLVAIFGLRLRIVF